MAVRFKSKHIHFIDIGKKVCRLAQMVRAMETETEAEAEAVESGRRFESGNGNKTATMLRQRKTTVINTLYHLLTVVR